MIHSIKCLWYIESTNTDSTSIINIIFSDRTKCENSRAAIRFFFLCVGIKFYPYIWNPWSRNFYSSVIKINRVIRQNSVRPCAPNHVTYIRRGSKTITYLESPPQFTYSVNSFYGATMTIKCRLHVSMSNVKADFWRKFPSPVENGPQNGGFLGKWGVKPKCVLWHILPQNRVFWCILRQNPCGRLLFRRLEEPQKTKNSQVNIRCAKSRMGRNETPYPIWINVL